MALWKLVLSYDGTSYYGWQIQPGLPTIQGTLMSAIEHVTGETILPQGSGRTDAGVHALGQAASFELAAPIPAANLHRALNRALPASIRVLSVEEVHRGFHARHSAQRKMYEYRIFPHLSCTLEQLEICSPMLAPYVWDCPWPLDLYAMQAAASHIIGEHDFTSFAASDPDRTMRETAGSETPHQDRTNVRTIYESRWQQRDSLLIYRVSGSGFLHHMVRNLVGVFVDIGAHRSSADSLPALLAARDRSLAGATAPARGLFLLAVVY